MKKTIAVLLAALMLFALAACAGKTDTKPADQAENAQKPEQTEAAQPEQTEEIETLTQDSDDVGEPEFVDYALEKLSDTEVGIEGLKFAIPEGFTFTDEVGMLSNDEACMISGDVISDIDKDDINADYIGNYFSMMYSSHGEADVTETEVDGHKAFVAVMTFEYEGVQYQQSDLYVVFDNSITVIAVSSTADDPFTASVNTFFESVHAA